jgi:OOP family OmpA-OmpF porin
MKISLARFAIIGVASMAAAALNVGAQPLTAPSAYEPRPPGPFYVIGDIGGDLLRNVNVKSAGMKASFDPGVRGDFGFGYQFVPFLAAEFGTGALWNRMHNAAGFFPGTAVEHADLYQVPFLANLVCKIPFGQGFSGFIGVGGGGVVSELDLSDFDNGGFDRHRHSDSDFTFAYQGMAGLKFAITPDMEVDVGYKFLGTGTHTWFDHDAALYTSTGHVYSHSILASFTWHF